MPMTPAEFARERHAGLRRKGTEIPYLVHPEGVAGILARLYPGRPELAAAGWLHDTLEDTATTAGELTALFGPEVSRLVVAVTRRGDRPFHAPTDPDAMRVKAADALDNVTFTITGLRRGEAVFRRFSSGRGKVRYWRHIADAAAGLLGPEPLVSELDAAVAELEAMAGTGAGRRAGCAGSLATFLIALGVLGLAVCSDRAGPPSAHRRAGRCTAESR